MKRTLQLRRSLLTCLLISSLSFAPVPAAPQNRQPTIRFVRNPDPAPDFNLTALDGKAVTLAGSKGRVILLNFWATWCGPCRAEIPDLIELQNKYKDRLQILGLVVDDKHEGLRDPVLYETEIRALLGLPIGNVKVETFEDTGQIFLKNADRATELPGVDLSKLTPEQKISALHKFNAQTCNCGCTFTLAQCRIYDRDCQISKAATSKIIAALAHHTPPKPAPAAPPASSPRQKEK